MARKNILSDTDYTSGKDNRYHNTIHIGRVSKVECDETQANVRCIMPDKLDHEGTPLVSKPVPVLQVASAAKRSFSVPRVGDNVVLAKMPNGTSNYLVLGSFYTTSDPPPVTDPKLDFVEYDDGSQMQFNAETGELTWKLKGDMLWDNEKDFTLKTKGNVVVEVDGDVTIKPKGTALVEAANVHLKGAMKFEGNIDHQGSIVTTGTHRDATGVHSGGARETELEARLAALEQRVAQLEARHGS